MMTRKEKKTYWAHVTDCLVAFHRLPKVEARKRTDHYRSKIEVAEPDVDIEIFYHTEPFDTACDITNSYIDIGQNWDTYKSILDGSFTAKATS